jgi:hypothetical protein
VVIAGGEGTGVSAQRTFDIPFQVEQGESRIRKLLLHVSEDQGRTYRPVAVAKPDEKAFRFRAAQDGWYGFVVQTQDVHGRMNPASLEQVRPTFKVLVDTQPPKAWLEFRETDPGIVQMSWGVQDEDRDENIWVELEYRPDGATKFLTLPVRPPRPRDAQYWKLPDGLQEAEIRIRARDSAGNEGVSTGLFRRAKPGAEGDTTGPDKGKDSPGVGYTQNKDISIPLPSSVDEGPFEEAWLYVSEDGGKSYQKVASAKPTQQSFTYQARQRRLPVQGADGQTGRPSLPRPVEAAAGSQGACRYAAAGHTVEGHLGACRAGSCGVGD